MAPIAGAPDAGASKTQPTPPPFGVRIELRGAPRLVFASGAEYFLVPSDAALFALLLLDGETRRGRVAALIWPDLPVAKAQSFLRQRIHRLKKRCGFDIVVSSSTTLSVRAGTTHDLDPDVSADLDAASRPLLANVDYDGELGAWLAEARAKSRSAQLERRARRAAALEGSGQIAEALVHAERLAFDDATAEHAHRRVMRLHYLRGDRAAALAAYERCRRVLADELGTRPGAETRELAALIERSGSLAPAVGAPTPVAILRPPRMVGRDRDWRAVVEAWQRGQRVVIRGEPGIGKSRLAADVAAEQSGAIVQRAFPGDARLPYQLLSRLLGRLVERHGTGAAPWALAEAARLVPGLGDPARGPFDAVRMQRAFVEVVGHARGRGLTTFVIDDLQFADDASIELLCAWLAEPGGPNVLVALRSGEEPPSWSRWADAMVEDELRVLQLGPLDAAAVVELVASLGLSGVDAEETGTALARRVGGNPLFLLEALRAQVDLSTKPGSMPTAAGLPRLARLLEDRLAALPPAALRLAALAGSEFSAGLAASVLGVHLLDLTDAWVALEQAQVIRDGAFAHDLVYEATLRSVPDALARPLHASIAAALAAAGAAAASIAHHWRAAHCHAPAGDAFEAAAGTAVATGRHAEALVFFDAARECHDLAGRRDAALRVRCRSIESVIASASKEELESRLTGLLDDARTDSDRLDAMLAQCKARYTLQEREGLIALTESTWVLAGTVADPRRLLSAIGFHAVELGKIGRGAEGQTLLESGLGFFESTDDAAARNEFSGTFGNVLVTNGFPREARPWVERAAEYAERIGNLHEAALEFGNLSLLHTQCGQVDEALRLAGHSRRLHMRDGVQPGAPQIYASMNLGVACAAASRFADALDAFEQGLALLGAMAIRMFAATFENRLASLLCQLGQTAKASQTLHPLIAADSASARLRRCVVESRLAARTGRPDPGKLLDALRAHGARVPPIERLTAWLAAAELSPGDEALSLCRRVRADPVTERIPILALAAIAREADAARRCGLHDEALAGARLALARAADCHAANDMAATEFWWLLFAAFDAVGAEAEAATALERGCAAAGFGAAHLPAAYRDAYLHRSSTVPLLRAEAARRRR